MLLEKSIFSDHEAESQHIKNPQTNLTTDLIEKNGSDSISSGGATNVNLPLSWQNYQKEGMSDENLKSVIYRQSKLQDKLLLYKKSNSVQIKVKLDDTFFDDDNDDVSSHAKEESDI